MLVGEKAHLRDVIHFAGDLLYKEFRQKQIYNRIKVLMDVVDDHKV
jgi:hypothetical protein